MEQIAPPLTTWQPSPQELLQKASYRLLTKHNLITSSRPVSRGPLQSFMRKLRFLLVGIVWLHALFFGTVTCLSGVFTIANPAVTSLMVHRGLGGTKVKPVQFIPIKQITAGTRNVFIELEDQDFYTHFGISPAAIKEAMRINKIVGKPLVGGSTITQQLARNLFLTPKKSYLRKYLEAGSALILERILGKRRIMEMYLNYIEFGPGIFGLGQAAHYQYKTDYANLSFEQRVRLAVIITSPLRYNVHNFNNSRGMLARYYAIMGPSEEDNNENP